MVKCNQRLTVNLFKTVAWLIMDVHYNIYNISVFLLFVRHVFFCDFTFSEDMQPGICHV